MASSSFTAPRATSPSSTAARLGLSLLLALGAAAAHAEGGAGWANAQADRVDARQDRQADRIRDGVASGELTRRETANLVHQQRHINRLERRTEADGHVTRREAVRVEHAQDRASRRIAHAKHDGQARPRAR